eukprot:SAG25_NODE_1802_length_2316_cov_50.032476_2_plen_35_part_01
MGMVGQYKPLYHILRMLIRTLPTKIGHAQKFELCV